MKLYARPTSPRQGRLSPVEVFKRQLARTTHRIYTLPVVILTLHSRCNCRCVMCDIWQSGGQGPELAAEQLLPLIATFKKLNVQHVVLSGGEPLLHSDLWALCKLLQAHGLAKITLLSTGLLLARYAEDVVRCCDEVIVSLDGGRQVHDSIRNVPHAYERLAEGVAALKATRPDFRVTGRCVIQCQNYADLPHIIDAAHDIGLDRISFLAADVSSPAFNRPSGWPHERATDVMLDRKQVAEFRHVLEDTIASHARDLENGFIAESADKLRRLAQYMAALNGDGDFPQVVCNAPWVSTVIEAGGAVRSCFFQPPLGSLQQQSFDEILNSGRAVAFRRSLDVSRDPTCRRCVCTLHVGLRTNVLA